MTAELIAIAGPLKGEAFPVVDEEFILGRDPGNALCLDDQAVSRRHCAILRQPDRFVLRDLQSRNGTLVNRAPVSEHKLESGDELTVGESVFVFLLKNVDDARDMPKEAAAHSTLTLVLRADESLDLRSKGMAVDVRSAADLAALLRISNALCGLRDPDSVTRTLVEMIRESIPCERVELVILDQTRPEQAPPERAMDRRAIAESVTVLEDDRKMVTPLFANGRAAAVLRLEADAPVFDQGHLHCLSAVGAIASLALENAMHIEFLEAETRRLRAEDDLDHDIVGSSPKIEEVLRLVARVAPSPATVLIQGESGTGKELLARAIHRNSPRAQKPFVAINCANLNESLLESELFGHEKGAFTGAVQQKRGKLEVAEGGTLFLDEIGEMALTLQSKLLRVLQEREFERVGGTRTLAADLRVVAATNRNLQELVRAGSFRQDLFYRLNVIAIEMPALRERREDIPLLANFFASRFAGRMGRRIAGISPAARACLIQHDWPGNVRELENAIERAVVLGSEESIVPEDLPEAVVEAAGSPVDISGYHDAVRESKRKIVLSAIERNGGSHGEAARALGVNPTYLSRLIRNLGLRL